MKTCTKCGDTKELIDYYKNKKVTDGLDSWCKVCHNTCVTAHSCERRHNDTEFRQKQNSQSRASKKKRMLIDIEFRQTCNDLTNAYRKKRKEIDEEYRQKCNTQSAICQNKRCKTDPSFRVKWAYCRSMRSRNLDIQFYTLSIDEQDAIINFYRYCPKGYHVDHIYPISKGGLHCLSNLQYLTAFDNGLKGSKVPSNTNIDGTLKVK